jgi:hypothetical protein
MARVSRRMHLTVEECCPLRVRDLRQAGIFSALDARSGTLTWSEGTPAVLPFRVLVAGEETRLLLGTLGGSQRFQPAQYFEVTKSSCNFGGVRFWLRCPGMPNKPCGRRAASLYRAPGSVHFACRTCLNLTYQSAQAHDARIDKASKDPGAILRLLKSKNVRHVLLGVAARTKLQARFLRRRSSASSKLSIN